MPKDKVDRRVAVNTSVKLDGIGKVPPGGGLLAGGDRTHRRSPPLLAWRHHPHHPPHTLQFPLPSPQANLVQALPQSGQIFNQLPIYIVFYLSLPLCVDHLVGGGDPICGSVFFRPLLRAGLVVFDHFRKM